MRTHSTTSARLITGALGLWCGSGAAIGREHGTGARSAVIYVDADAAGANTGASWQDAFSELQDALAIASDGDEVWVAEGVYKAAGPGGDRGASFVVRTGVTVRGGFAGGETSAEESDPVSHETVLSGDLNGDDEAGFVNRGDNTRTVVVVEGGDHGALIDGVEVRGAEENSKNGVTGGGVRVVSGALMMRRCIVRENFARHGAGVWAAAHTVVRLESCHVDENLSGRSGVGGGRGGGVFLSVGAWLDAIDSTINQNTAGHTGSGGGVCAPAGGYVVLTRCELRGNRAEKHGGGVLVEGTGRLVCEDTIIENASATDLGGAIFVKGASEVRLVGSRIAGCSSQAQCVLLEEFDRAEFVGTRFERNVGSTWVRGAEFTASGCEFVQCATTALGVRGVFTISDCVFELNGRHALDAVGSGVISGCRFERNGVYHDIHGALSVETGTRVENCDFLWNISSGFGVVGAYGGCEFVGCRFIGNHTLDGPGVMLVGGGDGPGNAVVANCLFLGNAASGGGLGTGSMGAFCTEGHVSAEFVNCTFVGNFAEYDYGGGFLLGRGGAKLQMTNCLMFFNLDQNGYSAQSQLGHSAGYDPPVIVSCHIQGLTDVDPGFVDVIGPDGLAFTGDEDLRLGAGSACIDAGDSTLVGAVIGNSDACIGDIDPLLDLSGHARIVDDPDAADTGVGAWANGFGPVVDIGAYEAASGPVDACGGDYNGDGCHDSADLDAFLADFEGYFGGSGTAVPDFNGDGVVDEFDYDDFANALFAGC